MIDLSGVLRFDECNVGTKTKYVNKKQIKLREN